MEQPLEPAVDASRLKLPAVPRMKAAEAEAAIAAVVDSVEEDATAIEAAEAAAAAHGLSSDSRETERRASLWMTRTPE